MTTIKFNNTELTLQPTFFRWMPRITLGTSGSGHPIYPGVHEFQLSWGIMPLSDYDQIRDFYNALGVTGTVVAYLPDINQNSYTFKNYSGCTLREPEAGQYFTQHVTDVTLMVTNIRV